MAAKNRPVKSLKGMGCRSWTKECLGVLLSDCIREALGRRPWNQEGHSCYLTDKHKNLVTDLTFKIKLLFPS